MANFRVFRNLATQNYVDSTINTTEGNFVSKSGDTMEGDLNFNSTLKAISLADPVSDQDAATKAYVDSSITKHIITIYAEESGNTGTGNYEWAFGANAGGTGHVNSGYTMMSDGRLIRMGLAGSLANGSAPGLLTVNVVVDGTENTSYGVTKANLSYSGTNVFGTPLELSQGDRVNFRTGSGTVGNSFVVSALIEIDL